MKQLNLLLRFLLLLLLTVILLTYTLLYTKFGLETSLHTIAKFLPGQFEVGSVGGMSSHMLLKDVRFKTTTVEIDIKNLEVFWQPWLLLSQRTLSISQLNANGVEIHFLTPFHFFNYIAREKLKQLNLNYLYASDITIYQNNALTSQIKYISINPLDSQFNQFIMKYPEGFIQGKYIFGDLIRLNWQLFMTGTHVNSNYLYPNTDSHLSFHLSSTGEWNDTTKKMTLDINTINGDIRKNSVLGNINILFDKETLFFNKFNLEIGKAFINLQGEIGKIWNLAWVIHVPNFNTIHKKMAGSLISDGVILTKGQSPFVSGKIHAENLKAGDFSIQSIEGTLSSLWQASPFFNIKLLCSRLKAKNYVIPQFKVLATGKFLQNKIFINGIGLLSSANQIHFNILIQNIFINSSVNNSLNGMIIVQFNQLNDFFSSSRIKALQGSALGKIKLMGSLFQPIYQGYIDIVNGQFLIPELGIKIRSINFHNTFTEKLLVSVHGKFISGRGNGTAEGTISLNKTNYPLAIKITGNQLQVANTTEYKMTASPNLQLTLEGENATIKGNLLLPYVHIVTEQYEPVLTLPPELVFAGEKPTIHYFRNLAMLIHLYLGSDNYLAYKNLKAKLGGDISVYQVPGGLPTANGTLLITRGTYLVYNKLFVIDNGRLVYAGNLLKNPGLSILAMHPSHFQATNFMGFAMDSPNNDFNAGVRVGGTLDQPVISLIAVPPMTQDDVLSYLVFGQPRSSVNALGALSLLGTLTSGMNLQEPTLGGQPNVSSGFLGIFKMGLFNPGQDLNFIAPIGKYWKIETEASINNIGINLMYNYEK